MQSRTSLAQRPIPLDSPASGAVPYVEVPGSVPGAVPYEKVPGSVPAAVQYEEVTWKLD